VNPAADACRNVQCYLKLTCSCANDLQAMKERMADLAQSIGMPAGLGDGLK
jgi:hypothetical protein